jgi:PAS domain S-box-containing protein
MTLQKKVLVTIGATILCLILILYAISQISILSGFTELEEQNARETVEQAKNVFSNERSTLDTISYDWAAWDDTYAFVEDRNEEYIESNLVDEKFTGLRLNLILFINSSGQIVLGKAFDLEKEEEMPVPLSLLEYISPNASLVSHPNTESSITGVVLLPEEPMLIASRPILTSEDEGPSRGTVILGRYLDAAEIERLAEVSHLSISVHRFNDPQLPPDLQTAESFSLQASSISIQPLNKDSIAGYALLEDIDGRPALVLKVEMPRNIYQQGQATVGYLILLILAVGLVFSVVILIFLDKLVLAPLSQLSSGVSSIGANGNLAKRVSITGKDEVSNLAGAVNEMLTSLEQSQSALRESEEKYRSLTDNTADVVLRMDLDGTITYMNKSIEGSGYLPQDVEGKNIRDFLTPESYKNATERIGKWKKGSESLPTYEVNVTAKDGRIIPLELSTSQISEGGTPRAIQIVARDITERKRAEANLRESEEKYRSLVESIGDSIYLVDREFRYLFVNAQYLSRFGGLPLNKIIDRNYSEFHSEEETEAFREKVEAVFKTGRSVQYEHSSRRDDKYFLRTLNPVKEPHGRTVAVTVVSKDITDIKHAEDRIKASLKEKEILLKEIHHRVKNNLQVISSLLNLQSGQITDDQALALFRESQNRVKAMALIHEKLYQSEDLTRIDFADYSRAMINYLLGSYGADYERIKLKIYVENVLLDVDTAIPCGLIINELVSNCLKYAFPAGKEGEICIALRSEHNKHVLSIRDNGVGFPKDLDFQNTETLGLQLVCALVEQLGGTIELDRRDGTEFTITFAERN